MVTKVSDDVVEALTEDIAGRVEAISAIKKSNLRIYSPDQILTAQQKIQMPAVLYHYGGMQNGNKKQDVVFFVYLITQAKSLSTEKTSRVVATSTSILQEIRKAMWCSKSVTNMAWVLDSEIPDLSEGDKLIYRQRWSTSYHISN